jgi:hypothetical protein
MPFYGLFLRNQLDGTAVVDFNTDTIKVALVSDAPVQDTDDFFDDVTEITGTGYTAGGITLTSPTVTYDTASDQVRLDAADVSWTSSTITARYAVVYKSTGSAATSPLICYFDFGSNQSTTNGTFAIQWASDGIAYIDVT